MHRRSIRGSSRGAISGRAFARVLCVATGLLLLAMSASRALRSPETLRLQGLSALELRTDLASLSRRPGIPGCAEEGGADDRAHHGSDDANHRAPVVAFSDPMPPPRQTLDFFPCDELARLARLEEIFFDAGGDA